MAPRRRPVSDNSRPDIKETKTEGKAEKEEHFYRANVNLLIPNAPGTVPSAVRVAKGGVFALDGSEPIDIASLVRGHQIEPIEAPKTFGDK